MLLLGTPRGARERTLGITTRTSITTRFRTLRRVLRRKGTSRLSRESQSAKGVSLDTIQAPVRVLRASPRDWLPKSPQGKAQWPVKMFRQPRTIRGDGRVLSTIASSKLLRSSARSGRKCSNMCQVGHPLRREATHRNSS